MLLDLWGWVVKRIQPLPDSWGYFPWEPNHYVGRKPRPHGKAWQTTPTPPQLALSWPQHQWADKGVIRLQMILGPLPQSLLAEAADIM